MGLSLAGTSRSKEDTIDSTGILDVGDTVQLSIADRCAHAQVRSVESAGGDCSGARYSRWDYSSYSKG